MRCKWHILSNAGTPAESAKNRKALERNAFRFGSGRSIRTIACTFQAVLFSFTKCYEVCKIKAFMTFGDIQFVCNKGNYKGNQAFFDGEFLPLRIGRCAFRSASGTG